MNDRTRRGERREPAFDNGRGESRDDFDMRLSDDDRPLHHHRPAARPQPRHYIEPRRVDRVGGGVVDPGNEGTQPSDVAGLVAKASRLFDQAQAALRAGDFARYGDRIAALQVVLQALAELTDSQTP